jgi:DUF917 family protein
MSESIRTWTITADEIEPLLEGLAILGNGGGGSPEWGRKILENDVAQGRTWRIVSPDSIPDDWTVVTGGILASVKVLEEISFDEILASWERRFPTLEVIQLAERWLGKQIQAFVPFEPGGLNSPLVMTLSARTDVVAVDGDALGRAAPESQMTSFMGHGISLTPMPLIDRFGNAVIVLDADQSTFSDELGRWVVSQGAGMGANLHYPMTGKQLKDTVIPGTYSRSLELGKLVLKARAEGRDPVKALMVALGTEKLIVARIEEMREEERLGFYFTIAGLKGVGEFAGEEASLIIKNEAMLYLEKGEPLAMFPDSIYMLDPQTGRGYMSVELQEGMEVAVLVAPCHPRLRAAVKTAIGQKSLGPVRYGYPDLQYVPVEDLLSKRSR